MRITSTQFQQRVGYYLHLVDQGHMVEVERKKPQHRLYTLRLAPPTKKSLKKANSRVAKFLTKLEKTSIDFPFHDGVKYQRWVRS